MMLLAVDIGNTNITLGVFRGERLAGHWRLASRKEGTADEYGALLSALLRAEEIAPQEITGVALASVVPPLGPVFEEVARRSFRVNCLTVGPGVKTGVSVRYDSPREVGADRIVNAAAAFDRHGGPCVVVDFGTATTFDVVSRKGEYVGGVIAPGLEMSAEALFQKTARLPLVELARPHGIIGRNTVEAMQAGLLYGFLGLVEGILKRVRAEPGYRTAKAVATGGLAELVAAETTMFKKVEPFLTLEGLRLIWERNHK